MMTLQPTELEQSAGVTQSQHYNMQLTVLYGCEFGNANCSVDVNWGQGEAK
jgi:hypothetical protein